MFTQADEVRQKQNTVFKMYSGIDVDIEFIGVWSACYVLGGSLCIANMMCLGTW
jgi:hypothetical protein